MERNQLIALVRKETGIRLSADDPVLAVVAVNEVLFDAALAKLERSVVTAVDRMAAMGVQNEVSAKQAASAVINGAAHWLEGRFKDIAQQAMVEMLTELRQETARAEAASRSASRSAFWSGAVGAVALSGILGFGLAGL